MLTLLVGLMTEELGKVVQCLVIPVKVVRHRQVDIGGIQLQVDLPVDCSLAVLVEVLSHLRAHGSNFSGGSSCEEVEKMSEWLALLAKQLASKLNVFRIIWLTLADVLR